MADRVVHLSNGRITDVTAMRSRNPQANSVVDREGAGHENSGGSVAHEGEFSPSRSCDERRGDLHHVHQHMDSLDLTRSPLLPGLRLPSLRHLKRAPEA